MRSHTLEEARVAKGRVKALLPELVSIAAIGIAKLDSGYGLKVNLQAEPSPGVTLPSDVDGVPVRFEVTGFIRKLT
jgi:hypothetical protein